MIVWSKQSLIFIVKNARHNFPQAQRHVFRLLVLSNQRFKSINYYLWQRIIFAWKMTETINLSTNLLSPCRDKTIPWRTWICQSMTHMDVHVYSRSLCPHMCVHVREQSQRRWIVLVFSFIWIFSAERSGNRKWPFPVCFLLPGCSHLSPPDHYPSPGITCIITWLAQSTAGADHKGALVISLFGWRTRPLGQVVSGRADPWIIPRDYLGRPVN